MYISKYYEMKDYENIKDFITANNFATIVTNHGSTPTATHLPLNIEEKENNLYLSGHFAKANKQWQTIDENDKILIIFQGHMVIYLQLGMKLKMFQRGRIYQKKRNNKSIE